MPFIKEAIEPGSTVHTDGQGDVVTPPVVVTVFDSLDNKATDFTGVVSLALRQNGNAVNGALSGNFPSLLAVNSDTAQCAIYFRASYAIEKSTDI